MNAINAILALALFLASSPGAFGDVRDLQSSAPSEEPEFFGLGRADLLSAGPDTVNLGSGSFSESFVDLQSSALSKNLASTPSKQTRPFGLLAARLAGASQTPVGNPPLPGPGDVQPCGDACDAFCKSQVGQCPCDCEVTPTDPNVPSDCATGFDNCEAVCICELQSRGRPFDPPSVPIGQCYSSTLRRTLVLGDSTICGAKIPFFPAQACSSQCQSDCSKQFGCKCLPPLSPKFPDPSGDCVCDPDNCDGCSDACIVECGSCNCISGDVPPGGDGCICQQCSVSLDPSDGGPAASAFDFFSFSRFFNRNRDDD